MNRKSVFFLFSAIFSAFLFLSNGESKIEANDDILENESWNILSKQYAQSSKMDALSFEWEYFQIHSPEFVGALGFVLQNPRIRSNLLSAVIPSGLGIAFGGQLLNSNDLPISDYWNFSPGSFKLSAVMKAAEGKRNTGVTEGEYGKLVFLDENTAITSGQNQNFSWDLKFVKETLLSDLSNPLDVFPVASDTNVVFGVPDQVWNIHAPWPRAHVKGTVQNERTQQRVVIDGKGYRENSWGRYAMPLDGWDFLVFNEKHLGGVEFVLQTYHQSKKLDFLDLMFKDKGEVKAMRLFAEKNQLSWSHSEWDWDDRAHQCVPLDWKVSASNEEYVFEATGKMPRDSHQAPFLSELTLGTKAFFIQEQYPEIEGTITNRKTNTVVSSFADRGGGEFALAKSLFKKSAEQCKKFARKYRSPK